MEGFRKGLCSWWKTPAPALTRVLWFLVPLMVVSGFVVLLGSGSPGYYPWPWNSVLSPAGPSRFSGGLKGFSPPSQDLELRRRVVAGGGELREDALAVDYSLHTSSAAPPLAAAADIREAEPPVEKKAEELVITTNRSSVKLPSNATQLLPSSREIKRKFSELQIMEAKLQKSRAAIRDSQNGKATYDHEYTPTGPAYWNPTAFHRSYHEMEKHFKVFVYEEGEQPIFHNGPCGSIYSMEGNFISKLETSNFRTRDPGKASVFFLPFSVTSIVHFIYDKNSPDHWLPMKQTVKDYINLGPELSKSLPELFNNSIRALCNANTSEGFLPEKDVSIPEINLPGGRTTGLVGGPSPSKRPILAFFAGGVHGPIRPVLLEHWENKDPEVRVHKYLPKNVSYSAMMRKSKYCICPSGYEVASPRMVEALYTGCVPVIVKDHYVAPFSDVLRWKSFSVEIAVGEISNLKGILNGISSRQYIRMQRRGVAVRRHFEVNLRPKRYDVFHMVLHSVWLRRLNVRLNGVEDD
ncbi:exostosin family protein [Striga asiatica]|uniref:Exostosin family protein n=1 Tax=Striga asiatica TaxID=4170 RepID=A0A5A7QJA0_STRAF|nr:exostosin family protein [Striga asiatica]